MRRGERSRGCPGEVRDSRCLEMDEICFGELAREHSLDGWAAVPGALVRGITSWSFSRFRIVLFVVRSSFSSCLFDGSRFAFVIALTSQSCRSVPVIIREGQNLAPHNQKVATNLVGDIVDDKYSRLCVQR